MMKNICIFSSFIFALIIVLSGCEVILPPALYESSPIKISYDISYGYRVNCTGTGKYDIMYGCDIPEVLNGDVTYDIRSPLNYQEKTLVNNTFIQWNISGDGVQTYNLGLTAHVEAENYLLTDLSGENAASIQELQESYPTIVHQYVQLQGNETTRYIDPRNPNIITIATAIQEQAGTNNSLLLAKALFAWLKEHIQYQTHPDESGVQTVSVTLSKKTGDCDDLSFLYVALCRACQIPARFIRGYLITKNDNGSGFATAHAWSEVFVGNLLGNNGWIPVECACCTPSIDSDINQNFGVESAFHLRLFTDDGSNASLNVSLSSISYSYELKSTIELHSFSEISNYHELEFKKLVVTTKNTRYYE
jgi:transglutaminase-like putative cysteine protease